MTVASCPTCNLPLRVWQYGEIWLCRCPRQPTCRFRGSRIQGHTEAEAITKWLDPTNRRPWTPREKGTATPKGSQKYDGEFPQCKCGLRIFEEGATACNDCIGSIERYSRNGGTSCGTEHARIRDGKPKVKTRRHVVNNSRRAL